MSVRATRREAAIERMADHLLEHGLAAGSLRALAGGAQTSDRMLLYYFADKDELLAATLERIAQRLMTMLDGALPPGIRLAYPALLAAVWAVVGSPLLRPYMRLWLELAAVAARSAAPGGAVAGTIMQGFAAWVGDHLEPGASAALLLATVEGLLFLDAVGRRDLADAAAAAVS